MVGTAWLSRPDYSQCLNVKPPWNPTYAALDPEMKDKVKTNKQTNKYCCEVCGSIPGFDHHAEQLVEHKKESYFYTLGRYCFAGGVAGLNKTN